MNNINKFIKKMSLPFYSVVLMTLIIGFSSCDPTIDALAFDLPNEGDFPDTTPPNADFFFEPIPAEDGRSINVFFTNLSTSASIYSWTFGDGQSSTDVDPIITYAIPEGATDSFSYIVKLDVADNHGATDTFSNEVFVDLDFEVEVLITDSFTLVNTGELDDPVSIDSFSSEEANGVDKFNSAINLLDKDGGLGGDVTKWTANDEVTGDNMGDGEFVIFDLGSEQELGLIQFTTDARANVYGYQILTSTTGTTDADFSVLLPEGGAITDLAFTAANTTDFQPIVLTTPTTARYVKFITYGRFNVSDTSVNTSKWSNFNEMEFWSTK